MILGVLRLISRDDLARSSEPLPKWLDALMTPLNQFIEKVGLCLQNRLTFKDNFLGKIFESKFTHDVAQEVNPYPSSNRGTLRVSGVVPVSTGSVFITGFKWTHLDNGNIAVTIRFDGTPTTPVKLQIQLE